MSSTKPTDDKKSDKNESAGAPPAKEDAGASSRPSDGDALAKEREALARERERLEADRATLERDRFDFARAVADAEGKPRRKPKPGDVYRGPFRLISRSRYIDPKTGAKVEIGPTPSKGAAGYIVREGDLPDDVAQDLWRRGVLEPTAEAKQLVPAPAEG